MKFGTALITDVEPRTLGDYDQTSLGALSVDRMNIVVPHRNITSFSMKADKLKFRLLDFWQLLTMRMQKEVFQVFNFEMKLGSGSTRGGGVVFYAVPLGAYFKPKRAIQTRDAILRQYANEILEIYRNVLPSVVITA